LWTRSKSGLNGGAKFQVIMPNAPEERAIMAIDEDERARDEMPADSDETGTGSPDSGTGSPASGAGKREKGVLLGLGHASSFEPEEDPEPVQPSEES
jgi:hypothetical protein